MTVLNALLVLRKTEFRDDPMRSHGKYLVYPLGWRQEMLCMGLHDSASGPLCRDGLVYLECFALKSQVVRPAVDRRAADGSASVPATARAAPTTSVPAVPPTPGVAEGRMWGVLQPVSHQPQQRMGVSHQPPKAVSAPSAPQCSEVDCSYIQMS